MKKVIIFFTLITIFCVNSVILHAGIVGDINNDGKIGLEEAIHALQVVAGQREFLPTMVNLGGVFFDSTSDKLSNDSYLSIPISHVTTYSGYGDYAGYTKTHQVFEGESVKGVNAVRLHTSGDCGEDCWTEDIWFAFDTVGNCRILKNITNGVLRFETSVDIMPPVYMPIQISVGQSWFCLGSVFTVIDINASIKGYTSLLKLKCDMYGSEDIDYAYFKKGAGEVVNHWHDSPAPTGSGWILNAN